MNTQTTFTTESQHVAPRAAKAYSRLGRNHPGLLASLGFAALLLVSGPALAATAPPLGQTSTYGIVSSTFTNSNTAPQTLINGAVCFTTGPTTVPLGITGATATPCPAQVGLDQGTALGIVVAQAIPSTCTDISAFLPLEAVVIGANPPGTFPPGCYFSAGAMDLTATRTVTLNGAGVYIFRPGGALTTGANSQVVLTGGACATDVFWAPVGATNIGANAAPSLITPTFQGNILDNAGISIGHFANLTGRALAFSGTVLTDANTITVPPCLPFVAPLNPTTLTTQASAGVTLGAGVPIFDTATLSGGVAPTGSITFNLYANDSICDSTAIFTSTVIVSGNGVYTSASFTPLVAGTYYWTANYSGDANNAASASACNALNENVVVSAAVVPPLAGGTAVPTLSEWAMVMLAALLAIAGFAAMRRKAK
jgi:hypothetical protein